MGWGGGCLHPCLLYQDGSRGQAHGSQCRSEFSRCSQQPSHHWISRQAHQGMVVGMGYVCVMRYDGMLSI